MRGWIWGATAIGCTALTFAVAQPAAAQQKKGPARPANNWATGFVGWYPGIGAFDSPVGPAAGTAFQRWNFGSGVGVGAAYAHIVGQGLQIGAEGSYVPSVGVEVTDTLGVTTPGQSAHVGELMATGRITTGGGLAGVGFYLAGGAGAVFWGMPAPASSATDVGLRTSGGLEYHGSLRRAFFLEWGQFWAFHKHHGVSSNTVKYSQIRGGVRIGW
jgi:hypothetical protein